MNPLKLDIRMTTIFALGALVASAGAFAQDAPPTDELLWREIAAMRISPPTSQPYEAWFDVQLAHRRELVVRLRCYLTLYPGAAHRDEAVALELRSLFEIDCLVDGALSSLRRRAEELMAAPLSDACEQEAAYWLILCRRSDRSATSQPAAEPLQPLDSHLESEYVAYVDRYPTARRTPRLITLLFEQYEERGDLANMRKLADALQRDFPRHAVTEYCRGALRRCEQIGRRFDLRLSTLSHGVVDSEALLGHPYLVAVWPVDETTAASLTHVREHEKQDAVSEAGSFVSDIERFRQSHPHVRVIGIPIGDDAADAVRMIERLGLMWPQHFDERGLAGEFIRSWGVRRAPFLFVVDAQGILRNATGASDWREAALSVARD